MDIFDPKDVVMSDVSFDIVDAEEGKEVNLHVGDEKPSHEELLKAKFVTMLQTQEELNQVLDPNWRARGFNFEDAMMVETVELFDHTNWKWWKANPNPIDWNQVKMELVDVWHFALSRIIVQYGVEDGAEQLKEIFFEHDHYIAEYYYDDVNAGLITENDAPYIHAKDVQSSTRLLLDSILDDNVEEAAGHVALRNMNYLYDIEILMTNLRMTVDELYKTYIGKVELNRLRWANGYGTTYIKEWFGKEDNVRLSEIMSGLDTNHSHFPIGLRVELEAIYEQVKANEQVGTDNS